MYSDSPTHIGCETEAITVVCGMTVTRTVCEFEHIKGPIPFEPVTV